jgi:hypothetical protein
MSYTVKEYAKEKGVSPSKARADLNKMVQAGTATVKRCWYENPKKYYPTYSGMNLPPIWYFRYVIGGDE